MAGELPYEAPLVEMRKKIEELVQFGQEKGIDFTDEIARLEERYHRLEEEIYSGITAAQKMHLARHQQRPTALDLIQLILPILSNFMVIGCLATIWPSLAALRN